ncbi:MAG: 3'-5' exonuclease [Prevotella sp.]|nr:3'-5' exonuclease [Prevotella sp.]
MKIIYSKFDDKAIAKLPAVTFNGRIFVLTTVGEAKRAVDYLLTFPLLGLDTETRPSFRRGRSNQVALLQVSTPDEAFLFRLNRIGMCPEIIHLLEADNAKVGISLHDDIHMMSQRHAFTPRNFIDLQTIVGELGIEDRALRKLYANLFHQKISKAQQLSNWEADILTEPQKRYAATDAWSCINLYNEIVRLKETHDYQLIITEDLNAPQQE